MWGVPLEEDLPAGVERAVFTGLTGGRSAGEIEVLDGLAAGEHVIISSIAEFEDYDTIQVVD